MLHSPDKKVGGGGGGVRVCVWEGEGGNTRVYVWGGEKELG